MAFRRPRKISSFMRQKLQILVPEKVSANRPSVEALAAGRPSGSKVFSHPMPDSSCNKKHAARAISGFGRKNGDKNNKMRDKTAVLCGKPPEFSAKLFNKNQIPLNRNYK